MKRFALSIVALFLFAPYVAMSGNDESQVRAAIQAFHKAFDDGFKDPADYATLDWNHINPYGGRDRGLEATLKTVRQVHQTFLKGTTDTIEDIDIRFATPSEPHRWSCVLQRIDHADAQRGIRHAAETGTDVV